MLISTLIILCSLMNSPQTEEPQPLQALDRRLYVADYTVTAYTWTGNQTAMQTWPKEGRTCAGPSHIPLGTEVWIEGVGYRIVEDRTARKYDGRYDVYFDDEDTCVSFGKRELRVKIGR